MKSSRALEEDIPAWRQVLRAAQAKEKNSISKNWVQLATTATDGSPRVRTVVFRGWHGASELDLVTDSRSQKSIEIQENPRIEICWLLPKAKSQFRFRGIVSFLTAESEKEGLLLHWQKLSERAKAAWFWPAPGLPFISLSNFPLQIPEETPPPDNFELIRVNCEMVELLELTGTPHRRFCWKAENGWLKEAINP
ncbi:MAG: hypothetical protein BTM33_01615 [Synechococcus sp. Lanier]|nr:MAG: hypothetical protein BTM33_01615 [Synechococcus sp. Lanier]